MFPKIILYFQFPTRKGKYFIGRECKYNKKLSNQNFDIILST